MCWNKFSKLEKKIILAEWIVNEELFIKDRRAIIQRPQSLCILRFGYIFQRMYLPASKGLPHLSFEATIKVFSKLCNTVWKYILNCMNIRILNSWYVWAIARNESKTGNKYTCSYLPLLSFLSISKIKVTRFQKTEESLYTRSQIIQLSLFTSPDNAKRQIYENY